MVDLKFVSDEDLRKIIKDAEEEWKYRQNEVFNNKKAEVKRVIEELIIMARSQGRYTLGEIPFECEECGNDFHYDILLDGILEEIVNLLGR